MRRSIGHCIITKWGYIICFFHTIKKKLPFYHKRVLILKTDGFGDMLFWFPYMKQLCEYYSARNFRVTLVTSPALHDFVRRSGTADDYLIMPIYKNSFQWTFYRLCFWLKYNVDIVIKVNEMSNELFECYQLEHFVDFPGTCNGRNIGERYSDIVKAAGVFSEVQKYDYRIFQASLPAQWLTEPYILICIDASTPKRCWEMEKFAELTELLSRKYAKKIILCGLDREKGEKIIALSHCPENIVNLCGQTTLFQLFSLTGHALFLVSNETGTAHIAAVNGTTVFIICGYGDYGTFVPYPEGREGKDVFSIFPEKFCTRCVWKNPECVKKPIYPCITQVTVEQVFVSIEKNVCLA